MDKTCESLEGTADSKQIRIENVFCQPEPLPVFADHEKILQVLHNLIDNAIKLNNKERLPKIYIKYLVNIEREKQEKKQHTNTRKKSAYRNYKKY